MKAYLGNQIANLISRFLPSSVVLWCSATIGLIVGRFCAKDEAVSIAQLKYVFPNGLGNQGKASLEEFRTLARSVFFNTGKNIGDVLLWKRYFNSLETPTTNTGRFQPKITSTGDEVVRNIRDSKLGGVCLSGHLGSFEIAAVYLAQIGLKCSVIGRSPNFPVLESMLLKLRQAYGVDVIWGNKADAPRQIITDLRSGRVICALIDQDTKWKSEFSPFFGLEAASPIAPIQLALRYQLPIFTIFIVRTAPMSHQIMIELIPYQADDPQAKFTVLKIYNERLEHLIKNYPDQYIWWHRRWRRRPGINYSKSPHLLHNTSQYNEWLATIMPKSVNS